MAKAAGAGHRVVLVVATRGEHGEPVPGVLDDGEQLSVRRIAETHESAEVLGVDRVEFLGYVDSGMMGEPTNDEPGSFWQADVDEAAARLAAILGEEQRRRPHRSTTTTAATATPTTSRCTGSGVRAAELRRRRAGLRGHDQPRPRCIDGLAHGDGATRCPRASSSPDFEAEPDFGTPEPRSSPTASTCSDFARPQARVDAGPPQPDRRRPTSS